MAQEPVSLAFRSAVVLALAVIILEVTTFDTAATSSDPIYRPQHLLLYYLGALLRSRPHESGETTKHREIISL